MSDNEIIAVVQAHKEGKKIQMVFKEPPIMSSEKSWFDCPNTVGQLWDFRCFNYRVAPEPTYVVHPIGEKCPHCVVAPEPQVVLCNASPSQKRAEKAADEDGFKYPDEQRSGFIFGYEKCLKEFGITLTPEPRKAREWWIDSNASNGPWAAWTYRPCYPKDSLNDRCLVHVREVIE